MDTYDIAKVCHEASRAICEALGDDMGMAAWEEAPGWQRESCIDGVLFHQNNPDAEPADSHENWMAQKRADGWVWGPNKDFNRKTHPCLVMYDELPKDQRVKDYVFTAIVRALHPPHS